MKEITEYGLMLDCEKQGCDPHHEDDRQVYFVSNGAPPGADSRTVNNHAAVLMRRTVTVSDWTECSD